MHLLALRWLGLGLGFLACLKYSALASEVRNKSKAGAMDEVNVFFGGVGVKLSPRDNKLVWLFVGEGSFVLLL